MYELMKWEVKKYLWNRKVLVVFIFTISFFLFLIVKRVATTNLAFYSGHSNYLTYTRDRLWDAMEMNEQAKQDALNSYHTYVDLHVRSKEELKQTAERYDLSFEELWKKRYEIHNQGLVLGSNADGMPEVERYTSIINYADIYKNIVQLCIQFNQHSNEYNTTSMDDKDLTKITQMAKQNLEGKPYIRGYNIGVEYLSSNIQFLPFLLGGLLVVACYPVFAQDKAQKTDTLIITSKFGKKQNIIAKLSTAMLFATSCWLCFQFVNLIACELLYTLDGFNVSVFDLFLPSPYGYDYASYFLHQLVISYLGTIWLVTIICFLSQLTKPLITFTLCMILILLTSFEQSSSSNVDLTILSKFLLLMPTQMMSAFTTFREYISYPILNYRILLPHMNMMIVSIGIPLFIIVTYHMARYRQIKHE